VDGGHGKARQGGDVGAAAGATPVVVRRFVPSIHCAFQSLFIYI
jgi:hypothetical protein